VTAEPKAVAALIALRICILPGWAFAEPPSASDIRAAVRTANRAFERQDFEEAAHAYASLPPTPDRPAEVCYNEGLTFAALGDVERARLAFRMADLNAESSSMRADARFNLARLAHDNAIGLSEKDPDKAMEGLREAARIYRSVLDVRPDDVEAAKNVERSRLAVRAIQQRLKEEAEQQQQRAEQLRQMAEDLKDLAERQQNASQQSQAADEQMQQDSSIGAESSRQSRENQEGLSEETEKLLQELLNQLGQSPDDMPGQTEMSEAMSEIEQAMRNQAGAQRDLQQTQPGQAAPKQDQAAQDLAEAAERLSEAAQQQSGDGQPQEQGQGEGQNRSEEPQPGESGEDGAEGDNEQFEQQTQQDRPTRPREVDRLGEQDGDPIARRYLEKEIFDRANRVRRGPPLPTDKDW
jgi:hypothetical protein